ncbi:MAG: prepilin-type N-terminal cleavage/methylation domain-containing protein, partial [Candidatus Omnitrophica bacterium]|nr:prepilin-type N-terminal cleavage/methylation domain-containing protein [Candidatus Omnitrophota bacterium]
EPGFGNHYRRGMKGFSLSELLVGASIFSILFMGLLGVLTTATSTYMRNSVLLDLEQEARTSVERIVRELREASNNTITVVDADSDTLAFDTPLVVGISYYKSGSVLTRRASDGTTKPLGEDITYLKFAQNKQLVTLNLKAEKTVYNQLVSFPLTAKVKLRNEIQ